MACCPSVAAGYLASSHEDKGRKTQVGGTDVYEAGVQRDKLVLVCPDVWGWDSGRLRSIVDTLAAEHDLFFAVPRMMPPLEGGTDGDALPPHFDLSTRLPDLIAQVKAQWNPEALVPVVQAVAKEYKERGVKSVALVGYCFGAWIAFHVEKAGLDLPVVAAVGSHPSLALEGVFGREPTELGDSVTSPWLLQPAGDPEAGGDATFYDADGGLYAKIEARFPGKNRSTRFKGQAHGFVTRGDIKNGTAFGTGEAVQEAVRTALDETAGFLLKGFEGSL